MKKKLLIYAHYYYPDVASTGQILTELAEGLCDSFDITVICTVPSYTGIISEDYKKNKYYEENINGIKVVRVLVPEFSKSKKISRIKNILTYYFRAKHITKKLGNFDIVYSISQPPILGGMLGVYGKRKTKGKFIYNIQDFNPEQILAVNYSKNKFITNAMLFLDKRSCKKADLIITVGHDMQETLIKRFKNNDVPNNVVINNWINDSEIYPLDKNDKRIIAFKKKYGIDGKFVVMYSGNIGLYYDLENIIKIIEKYKDDSSITFAFVGEGSVKSKLVEYVEEHKMNNVVFIPYQDKKDLIISLNAADVHLVTNAKGIKGVSVPSKIYGCLATNVPVFGILEENSEVWNIINDANCGVTAKTGDYDDIEDKMKKMLNDDVNIYKNGRKYLEEHLLRNTSIEKYKEEINKL